MDKIIQHIRKNVVWVPDKNKNMTIPANPDDEAYLRASVCHKKHTDFLRDKGYTGESFKKYIPLVNKSKKGPLDMYFKTGVVGDSSESDNGEGSSDSADSDEEHTYPDDIGMQEEASVDVSEASINNDSDDQPHDMEAEVEVTAGIDKSSKRD